MTDEPTNGDDTVPGTSLETTTPKLPAAMAVLFEQPAAPPGGSMARYDRMLALAIDELRPRGLRDWYQIREIVDA